MARDRDNDGPASLGMKLRFILRVWLARTDLRKGAPLDEVWRKHGRCVIDEAVNSMNLFDRARLGLLHIPRRYGF